MSLWEYRATVQLSPLLDCAQAVHDGDTVRLLIDQGMNDRTEQWLRLEGVRAPETNQNGGPLARQFVLNWISDRVLPGRIRYQGRRWPFRVLTTPTTTAEPNERTTLARYMAYVYDIASGDCLNAQVQAYLADHPDWPQGKAL